MLGMVVYWYTVGLLVLDSVDVLVVLLVVLDDVVVVFVVAEYNCFVVVASTVTELVTKLNCIVNSEFLTRDPMREIVWNLIRRTVVHIVVVVVCSSFVVVEPVSVRIVLVDSADCTLVCVVTSSVPMALVCIVPYLPIVSAVEFVCMIVEILLTSHDLFVDPPLASSLVVVDLP